MSVKSVHKLQQSLPVGHLLDYLDCFEKFGKVKQSCFGTSLSPNYQSRLSDFKAAYLQLNITVTPCAHILMDHVPDFFNVQDELGEEKKGLGFYSEQAFEAMHSVVSRTLDRFPANKFNEKFADQALRAMTCINSNQN